MTSPDPLCNVSEECTILGIAPPFSLYLGGNMEGLVPPAKANSAAVTGGTPDGV
jgi:hypothetical protein